VPKQTVALLFGGRSSEHEISCVTAAGVLEAIDRAKFDVVPIGITKDGAFTLQPDDASALRLDPGHMPEVHDNGTRIVWPASTSTRELGYTDADGQHHALGDVDVVFPILHGRWGEDGTLQGQLEMIGLPYVGDGVLASALAMDKHYAKIVFAAAGIPVAAGVTITEQEWRENPVAAAKKADGLGWPKFVKPARAGSSVGVTKVTGAEGLDSAIEIALAEDSKVIIESTLVGREIELGVLGGRDGGPTRVSVAGEILVTGGREFYDFEAKYLDESGSEVVCPAKLSAEELAEVQQLAIRAFEAIGGSGLARADFFLTESGFVLNELNTLPGFTPISMFPKCWMASGLSYPELIDELIALGLESVR
jgi:D-alanine-D-alanine ligase